MVKGLKVLRHKRTEVGYFNEFLIAKTPDDVENCLPMMQAAPAAAAGGSLTAATATVVTGGAEVDSTTVGNFLQPNVYDYLPPTHHLDFTALTTTASGSGSALTADWLPQRQQLGESEQVMALQLCFSNPEPGDNNGVGHIVGMFSGPPGSTEIARQEVVVTSASSQTASGLGFGQTVHAGGCGRPVTRQQPDMAAGMSKMKINMCSSTTRDSNRRPPLSSSESPPPLPPVTTSTSSSFSSSTATTEESQRRRRERNRAAAARCRQKRQDQLDCLSEAVRDLEVENASLEKCVAALMATRSDLLRRLREHRHSCPDGTLLLAGSHCGLDVTLDTDLASLATVTVFPAVSGEEILLTPSLLLPPPLPSPGQIDGSCDFKLEPL